MLLSCWIPYDNGYFAETFAVASGVNVEDNHVSFEDCNNIDDLPSSQPFVNGDDSRFIESSYCHNEQKCLAQVFQ
ncbi:hypothetical protein RRG08_013242 [Elysia crispata]|uniref:Uncharacterized protein n=1 Tax=Elysia crispata TaxID=231223 RepID=A0AAE0Z5J8_9GAST|nr:hypothetical protein RRG08_013242 [Elysia crispata]